MELLLLVYAVENLTYDGGFWSSVFLGVFIIGMAGCGGSLLYGLVVLGAEEEGLKLFTKKVVNILKSKTFITLVGLAIVYTSLMPSRQTAIYMASAYIAQEVLTNERTERLGDAAYNAALNQLTAWSEEAPKVKTMLKDIIDESEVLEAHTPDLPQEGITNQ